MKRLLLAAVASMAALALAACGPTKIDMAKVQSNIESEIASQTGVTVTSVSCPTGEMEAKAGSTFNCTVQIKDMTQPATVKVTMTDDKGNISWELVDKITPTDKVSDSIKSGIQEQAGVTAKSVVCPPKALNKVGYTFDCKLTTSDGTVYKVTATVDNANGDVSWKVGQTVDQ